VIVVFDLFIFPKDYEVLKSLAKHVYETGWMPIERVDPEQVNGVFSEARFALLVGDGWVAHIEMYREDEEEDWVKLAEWVRDEPEVEEDYVSVFPLDDVSASDPEIRCDKEEDKCKAEVYITYKRLRSYARIFIDFDKNIPREVIEIAMRGSSELLKTQIVVQ
jgi:hypothetical protein